MIMWQQTIIVQDIKIDEREKWIKLVKIACTSTSVTGDRQKINRAARIGGQNIQSEK